jgi:hypothetical protein
MQISLFHKSETEESFQALTRISHVRPDIPVQSCHPLHPTLVHVSTLVVQRSQRPVAVGK